MARRSIPTQAAAWEAMKELGYSSTDQLSSIQVEWAYEPTAAFDQSTIALLLDLRETQRIASAQGHDVPARAVRGDVTSADGEAAPGLIVQLIERGFRREMVLGETKTGADGRYEFAFPRDRDPLPLLVRVRDGDVIAAEADVVIPTGPLTETDIVVPRDYLYGPTEYERVRDDVARRIGDTDIADIGRDKGGKGRSGDLDFLIDATGWRAEPIVDLVLAERVGRLAGVEPIVFYALLRGAMLSASATRSAPTVPLTLDSSDKALFYDAALMPADRLRATVAAAVAARIVPAEAIRAGEAAIESLSGRQDDAHYFYRSEAPQRALDSVTANMSAGVHEQIIAAIRDSHRGDPAALFARLTEIPLVDPDRAGGTLTLGDILKADPSLAEILDFAAKGSDDKRLAIEHPAANSELVAAIEASGSDRPEFRAIATILRDDPGFDLATGDTATLLDATRGEARQQRRMKGEQSPVGDEAGDGEAEHAELRSRVRATQRIFKLAPQFDQTSALLDSGIHSAAQIAAMGESRFIAEASRHDAFSEEQARDTYRRAYDVHVATGLVASELRGMGGAAAMHATAPALMAEHLEQVSKDNPNLKNLFSLVDLCACEECRSIAGAAAYLVDVLQFLKNRMVVDTTVTPHIASKTAKQVLFERRPDLGDIDLSCDNTNVPLPYIDVVCELLEQAVAPDPGFIYSGAIAVGPAPSALVGALIGAKLDFTDAAFIQPADAAGHFHVRDRKAVAKLIPAGAGTWRVHPLRQTFRPAAELAAAPAYVNDDAYGALSAAEIAFHLPFDLPHQEARAYFGQFGVSRDTLMRVLAVGGVPAPSDIAAEALGISDAERVLIGTANPAQQSVYWNTGATDPTTVLNVVDTFLDQTGLSYAELQTLLSLAFINPGDAMFIKHLDSSCDTHHKRIENLDAAALDRIHRFLRLRLKLGWDMRTLDQAVMADRLGGGAISDTPLLTRLADVQRLAVRLGVSIDDLIVCYGSIPRAEPLDHGPSRYQQIFLNPTANGPIDMRLTIAAVMANEGPPAPATPVTLSDVATPLSIALGAKPADLALLIAARGAQDELSFANLALLYGQLTIARALGRSVNDYLLLETLSGIDPLASPADGLRFADASDAASGAGIKLVDLQFWLTFGADDLTVRTRSDAQIATILTALQAALQGAYSADKSPFDPLASADDNKAALGEVVGKLPGASATQLSALQTIVDRTYADPVITAPAFIDALLLGFVDTTTIKTLQAALVALPAAQTAQIELARNALIEEILGSVSTYLYQQARATIVPATIAGALHLDADLTQTLLDHAHLTIAAITRSLGEILGDDSLIDLTGLPPVPPVITAATFPDQFAAIRLLPQIAQVAAALSIDNDTLAWLLGHSAALGWLELDSLPFDSGMPAIAWSAWNDLQAAVALFARYPAITNPADATAPFTIAGVLEIALDPAGTIGALLDLLALVTGWDRTVLGDLDTRFGLSTPDLSAYRAPDTYRRLDETVTALRKLGLGVADAIPLIKPQLLAADATALRQALKSHYPAADWLGVLKQLYDPIRQMKRDALVAYLLALNPDMTSSDDLFDYFLIDIEMCSCQPTSRIVSAHGSLQLFVQRCLLGIEPTAVADVAVDSGWEQWSWMQAYRVWQANRQVFLYPENWLSPPLRDDKSEPYVAFENALAQSDLSDDAVTDATIQYLEALDDISFLEVMSSYYEEATFTHHVFARTKGGDPHTYYYRKFVQEQVWTPWLKVDVDIKADHLIAFVRNGRVNIAWPIFTEQANPDQDTSVPDSTPGTKVAKTEKVWQIQLAVSEFANGVWTPSRMSKESLAWRPQQYFYEQLPPKDYFRFVPLDMRSAGFSIACGFVDKGKISGAQGPTGQLRYLGGFHLTGCKGYPEPFANSGPNLIFLPFIKNTEIVDLRYAEVDGNELTIQSLLDLEEILKRTPNFFRVTHAQQLTLVDYVLLLIEMLILSQSGYLSSFGHREGYLPVPLGTLMPYFFEDAVHDYVVTPAFYSRDGVQPPIRRSFSDIEKFTQDAVALAVEYLNKLVADPAHDLHKLLQELVQDPSYKALIAELRVMIRLHYGIQFDNFYHPLICSLRKTLYADGIGKLMQRDTQLQRTSFDFFKNYAPQAIVRHPYPVEDIDFAQGGAYAGYNWELFFHVPLAVAVQLSQDQQFERSMQWFHYIFNPTDATSQPVPQKYWQTRPFFETTSADYVSQRIDSIMNGIAADPSGLTIDKLRFAVSQWRENPFEPFRVARSRTVAFQQTVLMKYIDNLIAWGDSLFGQDTMESVNQATQMYVLADKLLGPRPRVVPPVVSPPPETYNQLEADIDLFGNALLEIESLIPDLGSLPHGGAELPPPPLTLSSLYFCIPNNPTLDEYWDRVADRLFKIRHCQDINGIERTLALFAPPIDPGALISARAAGLSIGQVLAGLSAPLPIYRFTAIQQKATELAHIVTQLGSSVLQAVEKRDGEALARLRATQEISLLNAMLLVKQRHVDEAEAQIESLKRSIELTQAKSKYYHSREYMNTGETVALVLNAAALIVEAVGMGLDIGAAITRMLPTFNIGVAGFGGSPTFSASWGSENIAGAQSGFAQVTRDVAGMLQGGAGMASTLGGFDRRQDEWDFQAQISDLELVQLNAQVTAATIRLDIAKKELAAQKLQIVNSKQTDTFLKSKFTNTELFDYMLGQLNAVHYRGYQLALSVAHQAERCYQFELGTSTTFIGYNYWNGQKKGLLSGEKLLGDIKQMDAAFMQKNKRELELTKHISLAQLDASALLELKSTGACTFSLPEALFDLDHPGHYFRRIKTVSLSIPCVAGPFTSVSAKLSMVGNRYRKSTGGGAYAESPGNDPRFAYEVTAIQSVATSHGDNDSGLFELSFHDDRYLPFEYAGAISSWRLELPKGFPQFDYEAIADVVLNMRYTARDGGSGLRGTVETQLKAAFNAMLIDASRTGLYAAFDLKRQFPDQWYQLTQNGSTSIVITPEHLPYFTKGHAPAVDATSLVAGLTGAPGSTAGSIGATPFTLNANSSYGGRCSGTCATITLGMPFTLHATDFDDLQELSLIVHYTLGH